MNFPLLGKPALYLEARMDAPDFFSFAGGELSIFSRQSPDSQGPNEDASAILPLSPDGGVLAVADGVGGGKGGMKAARIAIETLKSALGRDTSDQRERRERILDAIGASQAEVRKLGMGAATTLAIVDIEGPVLRPYHVGDSQIVVIGQRGRVKLFTIAHSPVGYAVEAGFLSEKEAIHHEGRHEVFNVIGAEQMHVEVGSPVDLSPRDTVVVGSDGLYDNLSLDEICEMVRKGPLVDAMGSLVDTCRKRMSQVTEGKASKPDDLSIVIFRR